MVFTNKSDFTNDTLDTYTFFGPMDLFGDGNGPDDPLFVKVIFTITLTIFMAVSIVGNVCICAVVAQDKTMRTPTNCYLVNLAVSDVTMALYIPMEIYSVWIPDVFPYGEVGCRVHLFLWDCLSNCSVLTIVAFTVERYLVVTRPFLRQRLALNSRVFKIIAATWLISWLLCIPDIFHIDFLETKKYVYCYVVLSEIVRVFCVVDVVVFFAVPMTVICVLYVLIALKLKEANRKMRNSPIYGKQDRDKAVKMLAAVAALFFLCWAPYSVYKVLMLVNKYKHDDYYNLWRAVYYLCSINVYFSTASNPVLYSLMSRKFRRAFKDFLKGRNSFRRSTFVSHLATTGSYYQSKCEQGTQS